MNKPAYFDSNFFQRGEKVTYGEFPATVIRHYSEGMWEVRLPGGVACVSGSDLRK